MRHDPSFHALLRQPRRRRRPPIAPVMTGAIALGLAAGTYIAPPAPAPSPSPSPTIAVAAARSAHFGFCHAGGGTNCVVDGDTFWIAGEKVRIADIDTPETHPPRCAAEAELGDRATRRLQALLNAGPVTLAAADRTHDRYGRRLAVVMRDGASLGETLVAEGLARRWEGRRRGWC